MASQAEARVRELLEKLREEMRWLDILRMLSATGRPLLAREGFEEEINSKASSGTDNKDTSDNDVVDAEAFVRDSLAKFTLRG